MTKTEQKILAEIAKRGYYAIETCYGRGSHGGRVTYGARERDAMLKLEKLGLIKITSRQPWQDYNRGYSMSGNVFTMQMV
jgi:hypothetical protein